VAAVVAYHLGHLSGGFLGVDVFFVLSGFLVTSLLLAEAADAGPTGQGEGRRVDLVAFWRARFRRLVPAVLVLVPVVLVAARVVRWPANRLDDLAVDAAATATWWENWRQIAAGQSYWDPAPSPFRHAWSLAIEEQFYVLWPLAVVLVLVLAARRGGSARAVVGTVAVIGATASAGLHLWMARQVGDDDLSRVYLGTDTRVFALLVGCALACSRWGLTVEHNDRAESRRLAGVGVVDACALVGAGVLAWMALTVEVSDPALFRSGGFLTAAGAAALLVVAVATPGTSWLRRGVAGVAPALRWPAAVLTYLGLRSYGIYLWSWPIQVLGEHRWPEPTGPARSVLVVVVALLAAEASYRLVEHPIRRGTSWARTPARRRPAWMVGVAVPLVAVVLTFQAAASDPVHETLETDDAIAIARTQPTPPPTTAPAPGEPQPLHVLILGDSVSFTIGYYKPGLFEPPEGIEWIDSRSLIGCGVLAAAGWEYPRASGRGFAPAASGDCVEQAEIERLGLAEGPDVVVMFPGAWELYDVRSPEGEVVEAQSDRMREVLVASFVDRARAAHEVGAPFLLVGWACPAPGTPPERSDPAYITWINDVMAEAAATARDEHGVDARYIEPDDEMCRGGPTGEATEAKRTWMGESNHVPDQESGVRLWREWLAPLLVREMAAE
jgi:peptidoglycan/LPS O-acetylase OafA/YrhL